jgi:hypothetical protein
MSDGAWRRYFSSVAALSTGVSEPVNELTRIVASWEGVDDGLGLDLAGFRYHVGDLNDRELAQALGVFTGHRAHFTGRGALLTGEAMELLLEAIRDECAERGLRWGSPV